MAEVHLTTIPGKAEGQAQKEKVEAQDFSAEIESQITQLITLGELLRKLEEAGTGEMRPGFFYGLADLIEGCADRITDMLEPMYKHMCEWGRERVLKDIQADEAEATVIRVTARELQEMAAYLIKMRQDPEFNFDSQAQSFINGMGKLREFLDDFFKKLGVYPGAT